MYAHVKVACAPPPHPCHMGGGGVRWMSTWVGGGGRQHGWGGVGWMSGSEGGWVEWGWDAYGPRSSCSVSETRAHTIDKVCE